MTRYTTRCRIATLSRWNSRNSRGYVLLVFTLFSALMVIGLYRILPKYVFEGQRIKEEELIFRAKQYQRGIQLFVRKFGRYPASLEELENTNEIRFIRQLYPDPLTEDGAWRLVHIGPNGVFYDSVHVTGEASAPGSPGYEEDESRQGESDPFNLSQRAPNQGAEAGDPATRASNNPNPTQQPRGSGAVQTGQRTFGGGGIAGVASKNEGEAIKIVGGFTHYNEWEFLYDYRTDPLGLAAVNRVSGGGQQQPQQQQPGGQQSPVQTPFGGQPPVLRNPLTGQPVGIQPPSGVGFGSSPGIPGSPVPIPGGAAPLGNVPPSWNSPRPPSTDPFARP